MGDTRMELPALSAMAIVAVYGTTLRLAWCGVEMLETRDINLEYATRVEGPLLQIPAKLSTNQGQKWSQITLSHFVRLAFVLSLVRPRFLWPGATSSKGSPSHNVCRW